jgi:Putative phage serine protease XkdF
LNINKNQKLTPSKPDKLKKTYEPTQAILDNVARGSALVKNLNRSSVSHVQVLEALKVTKQAIDSGFTLDDVQHMYRVLSRLETTDLRKRLHDDAPSDDALRFYASGGSAGLAWSRLILKQEGIIGTFAKDIKEEDTHKADDSTEGAMPVIKSVDQELMQVTYVAMQAGIDAHGDLTTSDEVRKAKESFNKSLQRANLFHQQMTDTFSIIESYLAPCDMVLSEHFIAKGTWLVSLQVYDPTIWDMIKSGDIVGLSIGATAKVETLE